MRIFSLILFFAISNFGLSACTKSKTTPNEWPSTDNRQIPTGSARALEAQSLLTSEEEAFVSLFLKNWDGKQIKNTLSSESDALPATNISSAQFEKNLKYLLAIHESTTFQLSGLSLLEAVRLATICTKYGVNEMSIVTQYQKALSGNRDQSRTLFFHALETQMNLPKSTLENDLNTAAINYYAETLKQVPSSFEEATVEMAWTKTFKDAVVALYSMNTDTLVESLSSALLRTDPPRGPTQELEKIYLRMLSSSIFSSFEEFFLDALPLNIYSKPTQNEVLIKDLVVPAQEKLTVKNIFQNYLKSLAEATEALKSAQLKMETEIAAENARNEQIKINEQNSRLGILTPKFLPKRQTFDMNFQKLGEVLLQTSIDAEHAEQREKFLTRSFEKISKGLDAAGFALSLANSIARDSEVEAVVAARGLSSEFVTHLKAAHEVYQLLIATYSLERSVLEPVYQRELTRFRDLKHNYEEALSGVSTQDQRPEKQNQK